MYESLPIIVRGKSPYCVLKAIGSGTGGYVFDGLNTDLREDVAIKVLKLDSFREGETAILTKLQLSKDEGVRSYVPKFHESFEYEVRDHKPFYHIVMEKLTWSLQDYLSSNPSPWSEGVVDYIALELIEAARYIHRKGYIHCDIKPANICFRKGFCYSDVAYNKIQLCLVDLGSALPVNRHEQTDKRSTFSTVRYATRRIGRVPNRNVNDDLHSIGYTLCELYGIPLPWTDLKANGLIRESKLLFAKELIDSDASGVRAKMGAFFKVIEAIEDGYLWDYENMIEKNWETGIAGNKERVAKLYAIYDSVDYDKLKTIFE